MDVLFALDPTSAFHHGVRELLTTAGALTVAWGDLPGLDYDAIVTASENADLSRTRGPVLVLPHGVGFHKFVPDSRGSGQRLAGVVPAALLQPERAWYVVSYPGQADTLLAHAPRAAAHVVHAGDPCYDRLLVSGTSRAAYRAALGVPAAGQLVLVSSTWGPQSLLGRDPELPLRLLADLPADTHRVALVTHPNVRSAHGSWRLRTALAAAREAGLLVVPPTQGWQATLLAADAVVGDHGSVTFYAAALGIPVLQAAFGDEVVPGTPMAELGRTAVRLDAALPLRPQLDRAVAEQDTAGAADVAARAFQAPGKAQSLLRTALYGLLRLPEPAWEPPRLPPFPRPRAEPRDPPPASLPPGDPPPGDTAAVVRTTVSGAADGHTVSVARYPAAAASRHPGDHAAPEGPYAFRHLSCEIRDGRSAAAERASVLTRPGAARGTHAAARAARALLDDFPGGLVAGVPTTGGTHVVAVRDAAAVEVAVTGPPVDAGVAAAVAYARLRCGVPLPGTADLSFAGRTEDVLLTPLPGTAAGTAAAARP
ncbi:hypothetical protein GCM10009802_16150 [Streptomyces synnematoformans]|uniref:Translation initiation factor 2 n=1 Tax=Streptomyces synnematoformans TaxID=415721 RepID=A0ABP5JC86_9ACTN